MSETDTTTSDTVTDRRQEVWVEKYRPDTVTDIIGQDDITSSLNGYVTQGQLPNLLFAGTAGIGKTTAAVALAKDIYGTDWSDNFLELNASDKRGIDVVRDRIKEFAKTALGGYDYRLVFLDEADSLTDDAQSALRRTMEQFSDNVRFVMSCNYSAELIDPIQSRCKVYRFTGIPDDAMKTRLETIADAEDVTITDEALDALVYVSNGDMRGAINALQGAAILNEEITESLVHDVTSTPRPEEIEAVIQQALDGDFLGAKHALEDVQTQHGLSGGDVLSQLHRLVWEFDLPNDKAVTVMDAIGECEYRIADGGDDTIQLESLLATLAQVNNSQTTHR